jgi:uncharacterized membrane protein YhaH (DUF805 family)
MRKYKEIDRSTFWLWAVAESVAVTGAFLLTFVFQQSQYASLLLGAAVFSFFYRSLNYTVRKG